MTTNYAAHVAAPTPQSEPLPGREHEQVKNAAGGFVFPVTPWVQLERFLILGAEGGTYYASERKVTRDAAQAAAKCLNEDGVRAVRLVVDVSVTPSCKPKRARRLGRPWHSSPRSQVSRGKCFLRRSCVRPTCGRRSCRECRSAR